MTVSNSLNFSYPSYNEMLTGRPDPRIRSNEFGRNPNQTVLHWLSARPGFAGRVAAFATWSVFDDIFDRENAPFPVHAGWRAPYATPATRADSALNQAYAGVRREWRDVAPDSLMHRLALRALMALRPRVLFLGYGDTDECAHAGRYDRYLRSARAVDGYLAEIWEVIESTPGYAGQTTLIVTSDHGRGSGSTAWRDHGENVAGSQYVWLAAIGPDTRALGEVSGVGEMSQSQIAATLAALLGESYPLGVALSTLITSR
jgi:hypothetical protein